MTSSSRVFWSVWRAPVALAGLTVVGLAGALSGEGAWRWLSCLALATPVAVAWWFGLWRRNR